MESGEEESAVRWLYRLTDHQQHHLMLSPDCTIEWNCCHTAHRHIPAHCQLTPKRGKTAHSHTLNACLGATVFAFSLYTLEVSDAGVPIARAAERDGNARRRNLQECSLTHFFLSSIFSVPKYYLLAQATVDDKWSSTAAAAAGRPPASPLSVCSSRLYCCCCWRWWWQSLWKSICLHTHTHSTLHILHRFISLIAPPSPPLWCVRVNDTGAHDDDDDVDDRLGRAWGWRCHCTVLNVWRHIWHLPFTSQYVCLSPCLLSPVRRQQLLSFFWWNFQSGSQSICLLFLAIATICRAKFWLLDILKNAGRLVSFSFRLLMLLSLPLLREAVCPLNKLLYTVCMCCTVVCTC